MYVQTKGDGPIVSGRVDLIALVNVMKQVVYTLNAVGDVVDDSPSWREFTGQPVNGYLGIGYQEAVHPDDREHFAKCWNGLLATQTEGSYEYRLRHHSGEWRSVLERPSPYHDETGAVVGWIGVIIDISERKRTEELLAKTTREAVQRAAEVESIYRQAPIGLGMFDLDLRYVRVSETLSRMNGASIESHIGKKLEEIYPAGSARLAPIYQEVVRSGISSAPIEMDDLMDFGDGALVARHFVGQAYPLRGDDDSIIGVGTIWEDVSDKKRAEENQKLLNMELIHRTKNLIAVVQSVASRSLVSDQTMEQARKSLLRRLEAISRAYASLTETNWQGAPLDKIIVRESEEHQGAISFGGPPIILNASAAQTFALVIHELATNAAKHGSLSVPKGRVSIRWRIDDHEDGRRFRLCWQEHNGPMVQAPKRTGFGHTLLRRMMNDGDAYIADANYAPEGLIYSLDVALEVLLAKTHDDRLFQARTKPAVAA